MSDFLIGSCLRLVQLGSGYLHNFYVARNKWGQQTTKGAGLVLNDCVRPPQRTVMTGCSAITHLQQRFGGRISLLLLGSLVAVVL